MSYCRFVEGDVYVFLSTANLLECCGCFLQEREWVDDESIPFAKGGFKYIGEIIQTAFDTTDGMIKHLELHKEKGHYVPSSCIVALLEDKEENDKIMSENKNGNYQM